jgi:putative endonuclease
VGPGRTGTLGEWAEQAALEFLVRKGLAPLCRNFQCRGGEIDLIMLDGDCLTFVEVRCRSSKHYLSPELTVDGRKQAKILRTAALFIARSERYANSPVRFDIVAITADGNSKLRWIQDAFRPENSTL